MLLVLLASAACSPQAAPTQAVAPSPAQAQPTQPPAPTSMPPTAVPPTAAAPTAVPAAQTPQAKSLTILAAASLSEPFKDLGKIFEAKNAGVKVEFSFAGSQQLAQQLDQGAAADVFASASKKYMDDVVTNKRVAKDTPKIFAKNRLTVIFPKDNPGKIAKLQDLAKTGLKIDLEDKAVPAGQYSLDFLDKAVKDPTFGAAFKDAVLKNVVSYEDNVKAVLTKVTLGEADAGIVYVSDVSGEAAGKTGKLDIPDALNTIASYPIATISDSKNAGLAKAFMDLVLSTDGQAVLAKYSFIPVTP